MSPEGGPDSRALGFETRLLRVFVLRTRLRQMIARALTGWRRRILFIPGLVVRHADLTLNIIRIGRASTVAVWVSVFPITGLLYCVLRR